MPRTLICIILLTTLQENVVFALMSHGLGALKTCNPGRSLSSKRRSTIPMALEDELIIDANEPFTSTIGETSGTEIESLQEEVRSLRKRSLVLLNFVTVLWGSQHAVIKMAVDSSGSPATLTLARFGIAALIFSPWLPVRDDPSRGNTSVGPGPWRAGVELGCWMFAGYALQAIGLETTSASRSCFLLYLNVKLVRHVDSGLPLFDLILLFQHIREF